jgi:hypothetical protein
MPFVSKRQASTCFSRQLLAESRGQKWNWDCERWLSITPDPQCLPSMKGQPKPTKCRKLRDGEKIITPIHQGSRGGYYFYAGGIKIYVPKAAVAYAKKKYGVNQDI